MAAFSCNSVMMAAEPWNKVNIMLPGAVSSVRIHISADTDENVDKLLLENDKVLLLLRSQILQTDIRLLYELLYVLHYSSGRNRTFRALKQVEQCINRLKEMKLDAALHDLMDLCPTKFQRELSMKGTECDVPSQPMLEWLCLKVLGAARLMSSTMTHCSRAFTLSKQTLKWEEFILLNVVITSMLSRLWVFFRGIQANLAPLYMQMLQLLREVSQARPMPYLTDYSLPEDMVQFLGPSPDQTDTSSLTAEPPPSASAVQPDLESIRPHVSKRSTQKEVPKRYKSAVPKWYSSARVKELDRLILKKERDHQTLKSGISKHLTWLRKRASKESFVKQRREARKKLRKAMVEIKVHKKMLKMAKEREDQMKEKEAKMNEKYYPLPEEHHDIGVPVKRAGIFDIADGKALPKVFKDFTEESTEQESSTEDEDAAAAAEQKEMFLKQVNVASTFTDLATHLKNTILWCKSHRLRQEARLLSFVHLKCCKMKHLESAGYDVQRKLRSVKQEACWASSPTPSVPTSFLSVRALRRRAYPRTRFQCLRERFNNHMMTNRVLLCTESNPYEKSQGERTELPVSNKKPARRTQQQVESNVLTESSENATPSKTTPPAYHSDSSQDEIDEIDDIFASVGF